jgi:flagellar motor switch protein FliN/FliY
MNADASTVIAEGFLRGTFDVLDAMLSLSFSRAVTKITSAAPQDLQGFLADYPVVLRATVKSGGAVALLLTVADASRFASLVLGEPAVIKPALEQTDLTTLREIAEPSLGGGLTNLMEQFRRNVEQPENVEVAVLQPGDAPALTAFLGPSVAARFTFAGAPDIDSAGVLLFSERMETLAPAKQLEGGQAEPVEAGRAPRPQLGEAEVSEILSGFGLEPEPAPKPRPEPPRSAPPNLDMVLDIRLVATARLGRIEMPIGDILALGPGSIIQVGHLVDEPIELLVNNKLIARGDVVVVDEKFGLRITEIVSPKERIESMH